MFPTECVINCSFCFRARSFASPAQFLAFLTTVPIKSKISTRHNQRHGIWNTAQLGRAVQERELTVLATPLDLLRHIPPLGWAPAHGRIPVANIGGFTCLTYDPAPGFDPMNAP